MKRAPMTPQTEPIGLDGLTFRQREWLKAAQRDVAELNRLLAERGSSARYEVVVEPWEA